MHRERKGAAERSGVRQHDDTRQRDHMDPPKRGVLLAGASAQVERLPQEI